MLKHEDNFNKQEELKEFLLKLNENVLSRSVNGHGGDHIAGVVDRALKYADIINANPQKYGLAAPVNKTVVLAAAAMHDIGDDAISRKNHNLYSKGIVNGELSLEDCIKYNTKFPENIRNECIARIKNDPGSMDFSRLSEAGVKSAEFQFKQLLVSSYQIKYTFDVTYFGKESASSSQFERNFRKGLVNYLSSSRKETQKFRQQFEQIDAKQKFNPELSKITENLDKIFPKNSYERNEIATAVCEHNIDEMEDGSGIKFIPQSIYSSILIDADKDDNVKTFAARCLSYAQNKWTKDCPEVFQKNGINNEKAIEEHVLHQAWERFRPPVYEIRPDKNNEYAAPVSDITKYKKVTQIKGVTIDPSNPFDPKYIFPKRSGADLGSVLDEISGGSEIANTRKEMTDTLQRWANPDKQKECAQEVHKIFSEIKAMQKETPGMPDPDKKIDPVVQFNYIVKSEGRNYNEIIEKSIQDIEKRENKKDNLNVDAVVKNIVFPPGFKNGIEAEKKFIVPVKNIDMNSLVSYEGKLITQTYLAPNIDNPDTERRVRTISEKNGLFDKTRYFYTEKAPVSSDLSQRTEKEREISKEEYDRLLKNADPNKNRIEKTRYEIPIGNGELGLTAEVDVYRAGVNKRELANNKNVVVEVELPEKFRAFTSMPGVIESLIKQTDAFKNTSPQSFRDVTSDKTYKNVSLSDKIPQKNSHNENKNKGMEM